MDFDAKETSLNEVADVRAGHGFRGAIEAVPDGNARVIQIRDLGHTGLRPDAPLLVTTVQGRKVPDWVRDGDIAFVARGNIPLAAPLRAVPDRTVCAPHLFLIRLKQPISLLPEFLAWQLNQQPAQRYFRQSAEGSLQLSIRRGVLEQTTVRIPPLEQQRAVVELDRIARTERALLETLIKNRETELALVAERLLAPAPEAA